MTYGKRGYAVVVKAAEARLKRGFAFAGPWRYHFGAWSGYAFYAPGKRAGKRDRPLRSISKRSQRG